MRHYWRKNERQSISWKEKGQCWVTLHPQQSIQKWKEQQKFEKDGELQTEGECHKPARSQKKLNDDDETQQHTDGQQHVCLVSLAFYCSIYGILWRQRYHQVWRRHGHIFTSLWCNLQLSFSRLIDFELWHLHLAVWVPVSGPNLQSYLQPSATKVDKLFNLRLMRILLHDRK